MEWLRFVVAAVLLVAGALVEVLAVFGVFKFKYVLNRIHSSAMGDTLGLLLIAAGMCVIWGFSMTTLKIIAMVLLFWMTSPVSCHLLGRLETETNEKLSEECEVQDGWI